MEVCRADGARCPRPVRPAHLHGAIALGSVPFRAHDRELSARAGLATGEPGTAIGAVVAVKCRPGAVGLSAVDAAPRSAFVGADRTRSIATRRPTCNRAARRTRRFGELIGLV